MQPRHGRLRESILRLRGIICKPRKRFQNFAAKNWSEPRQMKLSRPLRLWLKSEDAEAALVFAATKADEDRINFANSTLHSFLSSPAYEKKMGSKCAAYFHSLVASTSERFPDLIALFNEEEGGETSNPCRRRSSCRPLIVIKIISVVTLSL
ncbi:hypothetical protein LIER_38805 [Lithospermum erythrorhizon]|uniref:Uncharacterized protein n=1 Tax=Lithospermum erythrorhizon TaxID=34254 RepID=A0AAV3Q4Y3_LITER